jgi:hypothetical protein
MIYISGKMNRKISVTAEGRVIAVQNGKITWKTDVSAEAEVSLHDGKLFTVEGWTVTILPGFALSIPRREKPCGSARSRPVAVS